MCETKHLKQNEQAPDKFGSGSKQEPYNELGSREHDKIMSRTTGRMREISFGPQPNNLVPANPFSSLAESRFAHANPSKFGGEAGLKEWDKSTDYSKIPKKVKKSKG
jgi:hypothetical protein